MHEQAVTDSKRGQIGGLVLGVVSFLHPLLMVGSLVMNIRELLKGRGGERRWMNVAGLVLTCLAMLVWAGGLLWIATSR